MDFLSRYIEVSMNSDWLVIKLQGFDENRIGANGLGEVGQCLFKAVHGGFMTDVSGYGRRQRFRQGKRRRVVKRKERDLWGV